MATRKTGQLIEREKSVWTIRIYLGEDSSGKRFYHNETAKGTKKDAQKRLTQILREKDLGLITESRNQTLNDYLDFWLANIAKPRLESRTFLDYGDILRLYVRKPLGNLKITDIKSRHIQKVYGEMLERGLSARRVKYAHAVLRSALQHAVKTDILLRNEATLVELPKQTRKEMDYLNSDEAVRFLNALDGERFEMMFSFALATGMRLQEYCALQWKDIDFERGTATVQRALVWHRTGGGFHFKQPKTAKSRRTIPLPVSLLKPLQRHRIRQYEARLKLGAAWNDLDLVFASEVGTPLNPPNITRAYKRILAKANLRTSIRLYDLRHSTASLLLEAETHPKIVSERLGHSSIVLTMDTYSHVAPHLQQTASERLDEMIFRKIGTK